MGLHIIRHNCACTSHRLLTYFHVLPGLRLLSGHRQQISYPPGGFAPAFTDEEVVTVEIYCEYFKCSTDKDIYAYFRAHYLHFFPRLPDRTLFVRQTANLWQVEAAIQRYLTEISGRATDPVQIIDTLPLPVCGYTRSRRDRCFKSVADYGYCAAKDQKYYGFKLGLHIARSGMITHFPLLPARPHEVQFLNELVEGFVGLVLAEEGFYRPVSPGPLGRAPWCRSHHPAAPGHGHALFPTAPGGL